MNKHIHPTIAQALAPFVPMTEDEAIAADLENDQDKATKAHREQERRAFRLQFQNQNPNYS